MSVTEVSHQILSMDSPRYDQDQRSEPEVKIALGVKLWNLNDLSSYTHAFFYLYPILIFFSCSILLFLSSLFWFSFHVLFFYSYPILILYSCSILLFLSSLFWFSFHVLFFYSYPILILYSCSILLFLFLIQPILMFISCFFLFLSSLL